jgi:hypothetical protein
MRDFDELNGQSIESLIVISNHVTVHNNTTKRNADYDVICRTIKI